MDYDKPGDHPVVEQKLSSTPFFVGFLIDTNLNPSHYIFNNDSIIFNNIP